MSKLTLYLVCISAALSVVHAQSNPDKSLDEWTLEDVLAAIAEANGGMESIESITNARFLGSVEGTVQSYEFVILKRRPNLMRSRMVIDKMVMETGFDGKVVWRRLEQGDFSNVEQIEDAEFLNNLRIEADFDGPMIGPTAEGMSRRLQGVERLDRVDYFVVEVKTAKEQSLHYIDSRTFREMKVVKTVDTGSAEPLVIETRFDEIESHNGIWVAKRVEKEYSNGNRDVIRIDSVEMNLGILDFSFQMPKE